MKRSQGTQYTYVGFLSVTYPFLGASPDGIIIGEGDEIGIVEVKYPFVHRNTTISKACDDKTFRLMKTENDIKLCLDHDYHYQITGQLAITKAAYCDMDLHGYSHSAHLFQCRSLE